MVGLMAVLDQYTTDVDFVSISITRDKPPTSVLFLVRKDWETSSHAGAEGMFQIDALQDEFGEDISDKVDQGRHFASDEALRTYLAGVFKKKVADIFIEEL